jgi:hypothetical protein
MINKDTPIETILVLVEKGKRQAAKIPPLSKGTLLAAQKEILAALRRPRRKKLSNCGLAQEMVKIGLVESVHDIESITDYGLGGPPLPVIIEETDEVGAVCSSFFYCTGSMAMTRVLQHIMQGAEHITEVVVAGWGSRTVHAIFRDVGSTKPRILRFEVTGTKIVQELNERNLMGLAKGLAVTIKAPTESRQLDNRDGRPRIPTFHHLDENGKPNRKNKPGKLSMSMEGRRTLCQIGRNRAQGLKAEHVRKALAKQT